MNKFINRLHPEKQRGVAAVELALILPIMFFVLVFPIFFGRYFWHYTVVHKAANDTARYLSTISEAEMRNPVLAAAAANLALEIAREEIADLNPGRTAPKVAVFCGTNTACQGVDANPLPQTIIVTVDVSMFDTIFGLFPTGPLGIPIKAVVEVPYVGS